MRVDDLYKVYTGSEVACQLFSFAATVLTRSRFGSDTITASGSKVRVTCLLFGIGIFSWDLKKGDGRFIVR